MAKGFGTQKQKKGRQNHKYYLDFLLEVLQVTHDSNGNSQAISSLLQTNLNKLDDKLIQVWRSWALDTLFRVDAEKAHAMAVDIVNFSNLIQDFSLGFPAINLEIAIIGYQMVESVFSHKVYQEEWATAQNSLGNAYCRRLRGERAKNLETAIICYQNALQVYNQKKFPERWADIQSNLGNAYLDRIRGDRFDNLETAIICYQNALQVYNREKFSERWADTQSNLGNAYLERSYGDQFENLGMSIICYQNALQIYNQHTFSQRWAGIKINLGNAYCKMIGIDRADNIEQAIKSYELALQVFTRYLFPQYWAKIQANLGNAYCNRIYGDKVQNLESAICYYEQALEVRTIEDFPEEWASTQNNLGAAYRDKGQIDQAIEQFKSALKVYTHIAFPIMCVNSASNLGNMTFHAELWSEAIQGYNIAIKAVETSRTWAKSESHRQEILGKSIGIYQNMVQACINAGQIEKAFEYSERSRSKRLVDLMASYNLSQGEEIPPKVQELLQQYEELQQQINQERQSHKSDKNRSDTRAIWEERNQKIRFLETQKQQVWENLRREDPVLAGEIQVNPLSLSEIQNLIDQSNTAILSFYTTNNDTHIFVVQQNKITLHTCTGQGLETLQGWINQNWLLPYMNDSKKWEAQINSILRELAERLQISELISQHLQGIEELILVPHLLLHQIPFAALPTGEYQEYLGDKFLIRYTPSCQILEFCQPHNTVGIFNEISLQYGTVEDAEDNLPCARFEGEKVAKMYNIPPENRLVGSSQGTCNNYRQLAKKVNVLHSCHHAISHLDNPLESYLKLADGDITLGELMTPGWRFPQLVEVFLSCCETNLGIPSLTDDILTLSTGFLCAGAKSVVSTLWVVNDLGTAIFSIFYYQQRQEGKNCPEALQQAQIQLRKFTKVDLNKIFQEVETREKKLIVNRKKYPSGSIEYEQWKREYNLYTKFNRRIKEIENSTQQFPFSDPRYWAAFICHGLR